MEITPILQETTTPLFTKLKVERADQTLQEKVDLCRTQLSLNLDERCNHEETIKEIIEKIRSKEKLSLIVQRVNDSSLDEKKRLLIATEIIRNINQSDCLSSIAEFNRLRDFPSLLNALHLEREETRVTLALHITQTMEGFPLLFLITQLSLFALSEMHRLMIAQALAQQTQRTITFFGSSLPLEFVISHIRNFAIPEIERLRLTHRFIEIAKRDEWTVWISRCDEIAPSMVQERIHLFHRILQEGDEIALSCLGRNIDKWQLPQEKLDQMLQLLLEKRFLSELPRSLDHFHLSQERIKEIALLLVEEGSEGALLNFVDNVDRFAFAKEELNFFAQRIIKRGQLSALYVMTQKMEQFHLSQEERFQLLTKIMDGAKAVDDIPDWIYLINVQNFELKGFSYEKRYLLLLQNFFTTCPPKSHSTFIWKLENFLHPLEEELLRLQFVLFITQTLDKDGVDRLLIWGIPKLQLNEEHRLHLLEVMSRSDNKSILALIADNVERYQLSKSSDKAIRLKIAMRLLFSPHHKVQSISTFLQKLHLHREDGSHPHWSCNLELREVALIRHLDLTVTTLNMVPAIFSPSIQQSFQGEITLVQELIETKTKSEERSQVAIQLISLLFYAMKRRELDELSEEAHLSSLWKELLHYRNPEKRDLLFFMMIDRLLLRERAAESQRFISLFAKITNDDLLLPLLILFSHFEAAPSLQSFFFDQLQKERRFFKDGVKKNGLILFLLDGVKESSLPVAELGRWLKLIFEPKDPRQKATALRKTHDLLSYGEVEAMREMSSLAQLDQILEKLFRKFFNLKGVDSFQEKYERTIGRFRKKELLLSYAASLDNIHRPSFFHFRPLDYLDRYVRLVLEGTFSKERCRSDLSPHLAVIFQGREWLRQAWIEGEMVRGDELHHGVMEGTEAKEYFDPLSYLLDKLIDHNHLGMEGRTRFPHLLRGLSEEEAERALLIEELSHTIGEQTMGRETLLFERLLLSLSLKKLSKEEFIDDLKAIPQGCIEETMFENDLKALSHPKRKGIDLSRIIVVDTDDPNDLLLMGTEIHGSCQTIQNGCNGFNIGLLGYLLDGKHRMIAVKDDQGQLIGRCVLRMVWNGKKPLLFRERLYVNHQNPVVTKLLKWMALRRAVALKLPLLSEDEGNPFMDKVCSLGSPAPFEYVDAWSCEEPYHINGRLHAHGIYTLRAPKLLYVPEEEGS